MTKRAFARLLGGALAVAATGAAAACLAPTGEVEQVGTATQRIIGGASDTTDVAVVALLDQTTGTLCSGTLIASSIVLTAAHCVYRVDATELQVLVGPDISTPSQTLGVASVVAYPTYTDEDTGLAGGVDLGAVYLTTPVAGVTPIPLASAATTASLAEADVTLVGYGLDATTSSTSAGTRRDVTLQVEQACSRLLTLGGPDANACFGDSGGAVLMGGVLVAVISSGTEDCEAPSLLTRVDAHANWLAAVLAGGPADASSACPTCVAPDPSCGAATETELATTPVEAGLDATSEAHPSGSSSGGCTIEHRASRGGPLDAPFAWIFGLACLAHRRRGRLRASGSASVLR